MPKPEGAGGKDDYELGCLRGESCLTDATALS